MEQSEVIGDIKKAKTNAKNWEKIADEELHKLKIMKLSEQKIDQQEKRAEQTVKDLLQQQNNQQKQHVAPGKDVLTPHEELNKKIFSWTQSKDEIVLLIKLPLGT